MADNLQSTQGHENEVINVQGLKSALQKYKTDVTDGKVNKTTTVNGHALSGDVTVSKSDVGLGNVTNDAQVKRSEMGAANGVATLDSAGKVPSSQLPSYVDDVLEYDTKSAFPTTGEGGKIYVDKSTDTSWRWSGSTYTQIKGDLALGETSSTAYAGDKGKALADKLATIAEGAEVNVQSDWNAASGDAFIKNKPTSLPASDVSAWAKASTKPSYTLDEVSDGSTRKLANYLPLSGGTMSNTDLITNLNADLLDGLNASSFCRRYTRTLEHGKTVKITFSTYYQAMVTGRGSASAGNSIILVGTGYSTANNYWRALYKGSTVSWCTQSDARGIEIKNTHTSGSLYITVLSLDGTVTFAEADDLSGTAETDVVAMLSNNVALTRRTRLTDFNLSVLQQAVADQNLEKYGLKVGDEKTINGYTYVIAGLNPMKGTHLYTCTSDHVGLIVIPDTTTKWNASGKTSEGADGRGAGYLNSDLHYYLKNTVLPHVNTDLGAANLLGHSKLLTNEVTDGKSSNWTWESDCKICALSEVQVYGSVVCGNMYDVGEADQQLEVFNNFKHTVIFGNKSVWLRTVVSASNAAVAYYNGLASNRTASTALSVAALILFK